MIRRAAAIVCIAALLSLAACIPGSDRGEPISYSGDDSELPEAEGSSDWFMHNKVEKLLYEPLPPLSEDGGLPRSIGKFSLLGVAPGEGKEYRDKQKIFYVEEISKNRRMRVFSRDGSIFRIQAFTRLTDLKESDVDGLAKLIKDQYGQPEHEFPAELTYIDSATVVQFSMSHDFLVTDLMDISTCELPEHILNLIEKNRQTN